MTDVSFALSNFVRMMRESVVDAAAVDIKIFAEIFHAYTGTFDMPAGITDSPWTVPFKLLIVEFRLCEPENEIGFIAFIAILLNSFTDSDSEVFLFKIVENVVFFEL